MASGAARGTKDERRRFLLRESGDSGILAPVRNEQTYIHSSQDKLIPVGTERHDSGFSRSDNP
jgi:hypothetical protein